MRRDIAIAVAGLGLAIVMFVWARAGVNIPEVLIPHFPDEPSRRVVIGKNTTYLSLIHAPYG